MDRFEAMALLREVVDRGSLSAAGRSLRIPVPTLSRKISDLEARLGTRLLLRTTRRLTLTAAGVTYLAAARRILDEVNEAEREAAGEFTDPRGDLVITAPLQFGRLHVLPAIAEFLAFPRRRGSSEDNAGKRDRLDNQPGLEMAAPEVVLGPALQLRGNGAQDHGCLRSGGCKLGRRG